jgi:hypothetical protein
MNAVFSIDGLPELNALLDEIAVIVANPITREVLAVGGKVVKDKAEELDWRKSNRPQTIEPPLATRRMAP